MMEDNSKLFVFEKKEVVLIFVFVFVVAVTAFTLGVRVGKRLSLEASGYTKKDIETLSMKSVEEEDVETIIGATQTEGLSDFEQDLIREERQRGTNEVNTLDNSEVERRLREEMEKLATGEVDTFSDVSERMDNLTSNDASEDMLEDDFYRPAQDVQGKYTIQLYANQSKAAAQDFADAFIVKGYDVIINEASIPGKGTWYRVSIGLFDTTAQARDYLRKESQLFQGEDYIIQKL